MRFPVRTSRSTPKPRKPPVSCLPAILPTHRNVLRFPVRKQTCICCCRRWFSSWELHSPHRWRCSPNRFPNRRCSGPGSWRSLPLATHLRRMPVCGLWHRWQSGHSHPVGGDSRARFRGMPPRNPVRRRKGLRSHWPAMHLPFVGSRQEQSESGCPSIALRPSC